MKTLVHEIVWWFKKIPATIIVIVASIATGIFTKALWQSAETSGLVDRIGYGLPAFKDGEFTNVITGMLVAPDPWMYATILIPIAIGGGYLEYKYGTARMLAALFVAHIAAVSIIAFLLWALHSTGIQWVVELGALKDVGLSNAGFGALGAMTASLSLLWRRRIRAGLLLFCISFVLFSGSIWDLTHLTSLLIGIAIGPWVVGRKIQKPKLTFSTEEVRNMAATLVLFFAVTRLVSKLYPGNGGLLEFHTFQPEDSGTLLFVIGLSIVSIVLAYGLYAGRKLAWLGTLFVTTLLLPAAFLLPTKPLIVFNVIFLSALLIILIGFRRAFTVKPDRVTTKKVLKRLAVIAGALFIFNTLAIYGMRTSFSPQPSFSDAITESVYQIVGVSTREFTPQTNAARTLTDSISISWSIFVLVSFVSLIVTTVRVRDMREQHFDTYNKLLHEKGCSSIGWMTTWDGMSYWTNASNTAGFAYRLENNIAIVLSDPVGSRQAVSSATQSFVDMCRRRGWNPIFFSVTDGFRRAATSQHFKSILVGEDTQIDLVNLEFKGKSWQSVRSSLNLANKQGISMRSISYAKAPIGLKDQLQAIEDSWAADKALPEMGFTLGTLKEASDPEVRMHIAVDEDGTVHGMTSWMPIYKHNKIIGWTIDIMQRRLDDNTMRGVIEYLIAESALAFKQEGYEYISLSAAPLSHSGKVTNRIEKLLDVIAERMEPYYGFKSLFNFKKKFNPRHEPLYLCYYDEARLPAITIAIAKAYMPDNVVRELISSKIKPSS